MLIVLHYCTSVFCFIQMNVITSGQSPSLLNDLWSLSSKHAIYFVGYASKIRIHVDWSVTTWNGYRKRKHYLSSELNYFMFICTQNILYKHAGVVGVFDAGAASPASADYRSECNPQNE